MKCPRQCYYAHMLIAKPFFMLFQENKSRETEKQLGNIFSYIVGTHNIYGRYKTSHPHTHLLNTFGSGK